ncbi:MAG: cupin domain-containing protein [Bacteroidales bacterium]
MKKFVIKKRDIFLSVAVILVVTLLIGLKDQQAGEPVAPTQEQSQDMGKEPWVLNVETATVANNYYRYAAWTGGNLQMTLMSLQPGEIIDMEIHEVGDQFIRLEQGQARVRMGKTKDNMTFDREVSDDWAIFIPSGYWHQIDNIGDEVLKVYVIYAPAEHAAGTIHEDYEEAQREHHHDH